MGTTLVLIGPKIPALRARPGDWARLHDFEKKTQANSAQASLGKRPEFADIEFAARTMPDGTSVLYGRCDPKRV